MCRYDFFKNVLLIGLYWILCKIDVFIILFSRKFVLFSDSLVFMYGSYYDLEIGLYSLCCILDLFLGIVGLVDVVFDDNIYVYIV